MVFEIELILRNSLSCFFFFCLMGHMSCYIPQKPRSMLELPSLLKSVEPPHPGMSYNPSFSDHQVCVANHYFPPPPTTKSTMHGVENGTTICMLG